MKRKLSLILALVFIFTMALPFQSFGAGIDTGLENAIRIAKSLFEIPESYMFESKIDSEGGKNVFFLNWRSTGSDYSYIMVRIDGKGVVLSYESYKPSDYAQSGKLPRVSRQEARLKAEAFIKKVNPEIVDQIKYEEDNQSNLMDSTYYFNFYRIANGIPFYNNRVSVYISRGTGAVRTFYTTWTDGLVFPEPGKQITMDQAKDAYKTNLGLELIYKYSYSYPEDKLKVYMVYIPRYENDIYAIEAFTGEKIRVGYGYYGPYFGRSGEKKQKLADASMGAAQVTLDPDEMKAVQDASGLKTAEEAEKIARDAKFLELTDEFKLDYYKLSTSWPAKTDYVWRLGFNKAETEDAASEYASVGMDAKTGMITSFNRSTPYQEGAAAKYKLEEAKDAVDAFVKEYYPDLYTQVAYDADYEDNFISSQGTETPLSYSFKYDRLVNGIAFPDNGITADYDAVNGRITSFNISWFNVDFPGAAGVITIDAAYDKLFANIGLELQYKTDNDGDRRYIEAAASSAIPEVKLAAASSAIPEAKLVYSLKPGRPLFLDANDGAVLDSEGNTYKEVKPVSYTDIKASFAGKQIMVLAENGVYLDGTEFKPKVEITQKDFFILLSKTLNYYGTAVTEKSPQKDIDELYAFLEKEGIVKPGEAAPASAVMREDAVKFLIRALKYDRVADIKGIFASSFKDKGEIKPGLYGYVSIAAGLNIIKGYKGYFYPKSKLTREAAAIIIYNYLQV